MNKNGLHLPNGGRYDTPDGNFDAFTVLHQNRNQIPAIRVKYPVARILVRHYLENWYTSDPHQVARDIADWYPSVEPYTHDITIANEQNLQSEGHPLATLYSQHPRSLNFFQPSWMGVRSFLVDGVGRHRTVPYPSKKVYEDIRDWNLTVISDLRANPKTKSAVIHFPALSQGHSDDQDDAGYVGFEILRPAVEACDILDVHTYWNGATNREDIYYGRRYGKVHALFPDKQLFISEYGSDVSVRADDGGDYVAWLGGLPPYVLGACAFILDSDTANAFWILRNKPNILNALRNYNPAPIEPPIEPPKPTKRPYAALRALVQSFEKFSPTWYSDGAGHKSIGYGHQGLPEEIRLWTAPMLRWQAVEVLDRDLAYAISTLEGAVSVPISDNEWIALVSLRFNIGGNAFNGSTLRAKLNAGDRVGAAAEFDRWVHAGTKVLPGLVERRFVERKLFESK